MIFVAKDLVFLSAAFPVPDFLQKVSISFNDMFALELYISIGRLWLKKKPTH